jgi:branched-chain amino acid aminotransferase
LDGVLARREAAEAGADDALLLNTRGLVAEATAANFFLRIDGTWLTPKENDGALPGLARSALLANHHAREAHLTPDMLLLGEAAFLCNSLAIRSISHIGDALLGNCEAETFVAKCGEELR